MKRFLLAGTVAVLAFGAVACGDDSAQPEAAALSVEQTTIARPVEPVQRPAPAAAAKTADPIADAPEFWLRMDRPGPPAYATVNVRTTLSATELDKIMQAVKKLHSSKGGGLFITIACGQSRQDNGGPIQARGKIALDNLGAAQTGLAVGKYEVEPSGLACS